MPLHEELTSRIRNHLPEFKRIEFTEKKIFGGVAFLCKRKLPVGIVREDLIVPVISEEMKEILKKTLVREMDFTKKSMKGFILVSASEWKTEFQLSNWVNLGVEHVKRKVGEI